MSHIASIKIKIKDISALIAACAELGAEFRQGQTTIIGTAVAPVIHRSPRA